MKQHGKQKAPTAPRHKLRLLAAIGQEGIVRPRSERPDLAVLQGNSGYADRMYAIAFDLDTEALKKEYPTPNWRNGYADIKLALAQHGFGWQQGSVYFGDDQRVNAVSTVVAVQDVARQFPWFSKVVRDIRMLRIEENNDLSVALGEIPISSNDGHPL